MKIKFLFAFLITSLSLFADIHGVKFELSPIIHNSLIQTVTLQGFLIVAELLLVVISIFIILGFDTKTRNSPFWSKYKASRILLLELMILMTIVLFAHATVCLPQAVEYLFYPDVSIYKYLLLNP